MAADTKLKAMAQERINNRELLCKYDEMTASSGFVKNVLWVLNTFAGNQIESDDTWENLDWLLLEAQQKMQRVCELQQELCDK